MVKDGDKTDFSIKKAGSLYFQNKLCMSDDKELKKNLLTKVHNTVFTMHPGGNKMYRDFEIAVLVERNEKRCDRVCVYMFDVLAS